MSMKKKSFIVDMNHVKPLSDDFTNHRIFDIENGKNIYKALRDKYIVDSS